MIKSRLDFHPAPDAAAWCSQQGEYFFFSISTFFFSGKRENMGLWGCELVQRSVRVCTYADHVSCTRSAEMRLPSFKHSHSHTRMQIPTQKTHNPDSALSHTHRSATAQHRRAFYRVNSLTRSWKQRIWIFTCFPHLCIVLTSQGIFLYFIIVHVTQFLHALKICKTVILLFLQKFK